MVHQRTSQEEPNKLLQNFIQHRIQLIQFIIETADKLDEHHKNIKIAKVVTGSTAIGGTLISLAGLAFALPTGGLSLGVFLCGGILAATSTTAHVGSDAVEHFLTKSHKNNLQMLSATDEQNIFRVQDYLRDQNEKLQKERLNENTLRGTASSLAAEAANIANLACSIVRVAKGATLAVKTIRLVGTASAIFSIITLPVQVIDLAANGHALHTKEKSKTSIELRLLAETLRTQMHNIQEYMRPYSP